jgi:hypothetical protein
MKREEFLIAVNDGDFCVGDSFWIDNIEFEVKANNTFLNTRKKDLRKEIIKRLENKTDEEMFSKYEELANEIIDRVSDVVEIQHPEINLNTKIAEESGIEDPAVICGETYYSLEGEIAERIMEFTEEI